MKGTTPFFTLSFNPVMSIETRPEHLDAAETGALVQQREMMERSGIVGWLVVLSDGWSCVCMTREIPTSCSHTLYDFFLDRLFNFRIFLLSFSIIDFILLVGLPLSALMPNASSNFPTHLFMDLEVASVQIFRSSFMGSLLSVASWIKTILKIALLSVPRLN